VPLNDLIPKGPGRAALAVMVVYFGWLILLVVIVMILALTGVI
jgi:hypothetical protein